MKLTPLFLAIFFLIPFSLKAEDRFFIMGSGKIKLSQNRKSLQTSYRDNKDYDENALRKINALYGSSYDNPAHQMSLRFLEVLSAIQDHFHSANIYIKSGYRSPVANQKLRNQGKLAAQSSMHKEAAAADFYLEGVSAEELRDFAQSLPCCGVGYYHGKHIHLDIGPKRWWDESNSGTEKKEPQQNEKIIILTEFDFYKPGEKILFDFARITDYPILYASENSKMLSISKYEEQKKISLTQAPSKPGRYRVKILLDNTQWPKMPTEIYSNEFEVKND